MLPTQRKSVLRRRAWAVLWVGVLLISQISDAKHEKTPKPDGVSLVRLSDRCRGQVEVRSDGSWLPVFHNTFSEKNAIVLCRELTCGFPAAYYGLNCPDFLTVQHMLLQKITCTGREKHLLDCPSSSFTASEHTGFSTCHVTEVICKELPKAPYMEVYSMLSQTDHHDAAIVLKGHPFVISCYTYASYDVTSFHLSSAVDTEPPSTWTETPVDKKANFFFPASEKTHEGKYQCRYGIDSGSDLLSSPANLSLIVREASYVRLVGGASRCDGRLEVEHQKEWRPVGQKVSWGPEEAAVVCRQLGCGSVIHTQNGEESAEGLPMWRFHSDCDGSESGLLHCGTLKGWVSSSSVEVYCSDVLYRPNISVNSAALDNTDDDSINDDDSEGLDVRLHKGYSFQIRCQVEPQFPGGSFSLVFTGLGAAHNRTKAAVNHSATFSFSAALDAHQGNYSCVYHATVFDRSVSTQSPSVSVKVEDSYEVMLDDDMFRDDHDAVVCSGRLRVLNEGVASLVSAQSSVWDLRHASIVCRQVGCGSAISTQTTEAPGDTTPVVRFFSDCDGSESSLLECGDVSTTLASPVVRVVCEQK